MVIFLTYPNIFESKSQSENQRQRFPLTGTVDEIGNDIQRIKQIGIHHIIFGHNFIPSGRGIENILGTSKLPSGLAR